MKRNMQGGFHLVEVLVSVLLLSIGVLGAAGMQLTAMRMAQHSGRDALALKLAVDMANQIRAHNITKLSDEQNPYLSLNYKSGDQVLPPSIKCHNVKDNCSADELANYSIYEWQKKLKANLPHSRALVCRDANPRVAGTDQYKWECNSGPNGNGPLVIKLGWYEKKPNQFKGNDSYKDKDFPPSIALVVGI